MLRLLSNIISLFRLGGTKQKHLRFATTCRDNLEELDSQAKRGVKFALVLMRSKSNPRAKSKAKTGRMRGQQKTRLRQRVAAFELVRLRRRELAWKDAEEQSGITRRMAERFLPRTFFRDERGQLQVHGYDRYTRKVKIPTTRPGQFRWLRARGSRKASLVGTWNNAVKAAGRGDFSVIDAFPRNIVVDGVHLATSHSEVSRIATAAAESDEPFEDLYALGAV